MDTSPPLAHKTYNAAVEFIDGRIAAGDGARIAVRHEGRSYTYAEISELVNRNGNLLRSLGVRMEERVALLLLDGPEFAASFFGAIKIGAVPVPLSTMLRRRDYEHLLNDSRAGVVIAHRALWNEAFSGDSCRLPFLRQVVIVDDPAPGQLDYKELVAKASAELEAAPTCPDDAAFWLYSSGSTGAPKAAVHLQHDMAWSARSYARSVLNLGPEDITFSAARMFFAYGLGNSLFFPFSVGGSTILISDRPRPERVLEVIERERPTLFFGVPTLYASILALPPEERKRDLSSLRLCVSAGEPLPAEIYKRWKESTGLEILDGIGSTEVLHIFISNRAGQAKPGSSGTPVPGYEARLTDENGIVVARGEIGSLWIRGDSTCAFYWNQHEKTKQTLQGEWILTGDKYYEDEDGYYWFCGRSDDMLKVGGIWVSPIEVEGSLVEHPAVLEAAVVGEEDRDGMTKPKAFVILKEPAAAGPSLEKELKEFVKSRLAPYKYPRWIEFVADFPRTPTGKIQRFKLRRGSGSGG